jgi:hypothetical protein
MRLTYSCRQCNHSNKMSALLYADRIEMAKKKGVRFDLRCKQCGSNNLVHVDDVMAENDLTIPLVAIISILASALLTWLIWDKGFIEKLSLFLPFIAVAAITKQERTKIQIFNFAKYDSKRKL